MKEDNEFSKKVERIETCRCHNIKALALNFCDVAHGSFLVPGGPACTMFCGLLRDYYPGFISSMEKGNNSGYCVCPRCGNPLCRGCWIAEGPPLVEKRL